jgi:L-lactate dehydrogenase
MEKIAEAVRHSAYHIIEATGATNYGVSLAVRRILEAIIRDENSVLTVSTWLSGQYGFSDICLSVPCIINRKGVAQVIETPLDKSEEENLVRSAEIVKNTNQKRLK